MPVHPRDGYFHLNQGDRNAIYRQAGDCNHDSDARSSPMVYSQSQAIFAGVLCRSSSYPSLRDLWQGREYLDSRILGKGKNRRFAFYPARTVMENTFRLEYFTRQKNDVQEEIATKECLRICKRHYDNEKANNEKLATLEFKKYYDRFN